MTGSFILYLSYYTFENPPLNVNLKWSKKNMKGFLKQMQYLSDAWVELSLISFLIVITKMNKDCWKFPTF